MFSCGRPSNNHTFCTLSYSHIDNACLKKERKPLISLRWECTDYCFLVSPTSIRLSLGFRSVVCLQVLFLQVPFVKISPRTCRKWTQCTNTKFQEFVYPRRKYHLAQSSSVLCLSFGKFWELCLSNPQTVLMVAMTILMFGLPMTLIGDLQDGLLRGHYMDQWVHGRCCSVDPCDS